MTYLVPNQSFNAAEWARNKVIYSNQFRDAVVNQYQVAYEKFWDLGIGPSGRSQEDFNSILSEMGVASVDILTDSAAYVASLNENYPNVLPELYHSAPYPYNIVDGTLQITGELTQAWVDELDSRNA